MSIQLVFPHQLVHMVHSFFLSLVSAAAECKQNRLGQREGNCIGIGESQPSHAGGDDHIRPVGQRAGHLVGKQNDFCALFLGHVHQNEIQFRIPGKTVYNQAVAAGDINQPFQCGSVGMEHREYIRNKKKQLTGHILRTTGRAAKSGDKFSPAG